LKPDVPEAGANRELNLDAVLDIPVTLSMEVGRSRISIRNLLQLNQGSVVELERAIGEPLRQRHADCPRRGGRGERQVRHPPDRRHQSGRTDPAIEIGRLKI
jgi:hypothetical protein